MKLGILTFHDALNYGAILQAFALQSYLAQSTKKEVEIIDYRPNGAPGLQPTTYKASNPIKQLIGNCISYYYKRSLSLRDKRFRQFVQRHHNLSKKIYTSLEDFNEYCTDYSILIAGSDQVFNPKKDSQVYYLGFDCHNSKRIAYAPSVGLSELTIQQKEMIAPWICNFNALSCREIEGSKLLSQICGYDVPIVCDPVCLIHREQWSSIAVRPDYRNYIFVFDLNGGKPLYDLALKLKEQTKLPIVYSSLKAIHPYTRDCKYRHDLGPSEWLGHIANASYVVTDSFHGTMLSLILGTPVLNKIAVASTSSRITTIMNRLDLGDQLIFDADNFQINQIRFVDYKKSLVDFIDESKAFLDTAIKNCLTE